jgi:hypothetical protein
LRSRQRPLQYFESAFTTGQSVAVSGVVPDRLRQWRGIRLETQMPGQVLELGLDWTRSELEAITSVSAQSGHCHDNLASRRGPKMLAESCESWPMP